MPSVGVVRDVWRYPVKSMRGERIEEVFVGFSGVYCDRMYTWLSPDCPKGFPHLTAREQPRMFHYQPVFRNPGAAVRPVNLAEAQSMGPGITPVYASEGELEVEVITPDGRRLAIDDPALAAELSEGLGDSANLTLLRSERALTDCRPVSLISLQTASRFEKEQGGEVDPRRFRANLLLDLPGSDGLAEDTWIGRRVRIGDRAVVYVLEKDPRCKMITFDPDTGESDPRIMRSVAQANSGAAGVYAAVLVEGMVRRGDGVELLD